MPSHTSRGNLHGVCLGDWLLGAGPVQGIEQAGQLWGDRADLLLTGCPCHPSDLEISQTVIALPGWRCTAVTHSANIYLSLAMGQRLPQAVNIQWGKDIPTPWYVEWYYLPRNMTMCQAAVTKVIDWEAKVRYVLLVALQVLSPRSRYQLIWLPMGALFLAYQ